MIQRLEKILRKDRGLAGAVDASSATFAPWVDSAACFFPEYTDHGMRHVQEVLDSAASLMPDEAFKLLSPADAAVLMLSALLHDAALHLTEDGFRTLISGPPRTTVAAGDLSWPVLWAGFVAEASRFHDRTLIALTGEGAAARLFDLLDRPMTQRDRLLVGHFLRRHHARLAHEIALSGVPGPNPAHSLRLQLIP